ncbi:cupin domain-containing protein [Adhaeribacter radiodurans]|uniref:Cupin domain-containing protein n=1 Tax=Adhaeribacter radiodurans TaxID=2745197 RepID=A0A7L7L1P7_9BACT|nr:cupin domain-containing protein [Adhaeribacter radiodurans]QMU26704.1 cupin domain-containing protein [Adhaeribacter radiodurans]
MAYPNKTIRHPKTGQEIQFLLTAKETNGQLLHMQTTYQAHSTEPPAHYHPNQEEDFRVLEGEIKVRINGQVKLLKQGEALHIPRNTIHTMWNATERPAVVDWQVRPALNTDHFFETHMGLANEGKTNEAGIPNIWQIALIARYFADVFRLAKPSFMVQRVLFALLTPIAYLLGYRPTYKKYLD